MTRAIETVDEPITIVAYDPSWPELFDAERLRIRRALGRTPVRIEHFGSTAVPGMAGKPIIDLLVGCRDLQSAYECVPFLEALGYENFGEIFIPGRLYLRLRGPHRCNVALTAEGSDFWTDQIMLSDYLRAHPADAAAYAAEKRRAFAEGARLFSTYSQAKEPFLTVLKERARQWHAARR